MHPRQSMSGCDFWSIRPSDGRPIMRQTKCDELRFPEVKQMFHFSLFSSIFFIFSLSSQLLTPRSSFFLVQRTNGQTNEQTNRRTVRIFDLRNFCFAGCRSALRLSVVEDTQPWLAKRRQPFPTPTRLVTTFVSSKASTFFSLIHHKKLSAIGRVLAYFPSQAPTVGQTTTTTDGQSI